MIDIRQHAFLVDTKEKQVDITRERGWSHTVHKDKPAPFNTITKTPMSR